MTRLFFCDFLAEILWPSKPAEQAEPEMLGALHFFEYPVNIQENSSEKENFFQRKRIREFFCKENSGGKRDKISIL